jgi:hypothetical protein
MPLSPIVIAALRHGLGNQMFQYAMGRALAERLGVPLKLDLTECKNHPTRPFALGGFRVPVVEATRDEICALRPEASPLRRRIERTGLLRPRTSERVFQESRFYHFDPRVLELEAPVYVDGFWQSARYFETLRPRLAQEFVPRERATGAAAALLERIEAVEAVCVHVRRGDYLTHESLRVLPQEYYERAIAEIQARVAAPVFVVFSDDPEWTRAHLRMPEPVIWSFEHGRFSALDDMQLMGACKHFIIANSSFSFWPAWLSSHPGKQVVRASQWFQKPDWHTPELREPDWTMLSA